MTEIKPKSAREKFWWFIHNMFAHPMSEILYWLWLENWGNWLHDATVPKHEPHEGRG